MRSEVLTAAKKWIVYIVMGRISLVLLLNLHRPKLSTSEQLDFSPEDGSSIFLRNIGIYLQVNAALQPRRPALAAENLKFIFIPTPPQAGSIKFTGVKLNS
jgi:hypothetical protein